MPATSFETWVPASSPESSSDSRHLGSQLGIAADHAERQRQALTHRDDSPEGHNGTRHAAATVHVELIRRGWT